MTVGILETRKRLHEILSTQVGLHRLIAPVPDAATEDSFDDAEVSESKAPTYVLRSLGEAAGDGMIGASVIQRKHRFELQLSVFAGFDVDKHCTELSVLCQQAIDALENGNNHNRTLTGMHWAGAFTVGEQQLVQERLRCAVSFEVLYDHAVAAMAG